MAIIKKEYVHGTHWSTVINQDKEMPEILVKTLHDKNGDVYISDDSQNSGFIGYEPPVRVLVLSQVDKTNKNLDVISAYPFLYVYNPISIIIEKIEEWPNGLEATIHGITPIGSILGFFDTLYYLNKDKYKIGSKYTFNISALAYSILKRSEYSESIAKKGPIKGEKFESSGLSGYIPSENYIDDISFYFPFDKFDKKIKFRNSFFYKMSFKLYSLKEDGRFISFPIFIRKEVLSGYKPLKRDPIMGTAWLQGYLLGNYTSILS